MDKHDIAWSLVRCAGLWFLIQSLMLLPELLVILPSVIQLILSWDLVSDLSWLDLLNRGAMDHAYSVLAKTTIYFTITAVLLVRGEDLMERIH